MVEIEMKPDTRRPGRVAPTESESGVDHFHWRVSARQHAWRPPTDVFVTDDAVIVRVESPHSDPGSAAVEDRRCLAGASDPSLDRQSAAGRTG